MFDFLARLFLCIAGVCVEWGFLSRYLPSVMSIQVSNAGGFSFTVGFFLIAISALFFVRVTKLLGK